MGKVRGEGAVYFSERFGLKGRRKVAGRWKCAVKQERDLSMFKVKGDNTAEGADHELSKCPEKTGDKRSNHS